MVMAGFALSCFGLLLFLWLAFGGPIPLKPKGYRFASASRRPTQLAQEADVRISGVSVGKVKTIDARHADGPLGRDDRDRRARTRRCRATRGRSCARRRCSARPTSSSRPARPAAPKLPEGGALPAAQVAPTVELDEIFRAFDAPTRDAFRDVDGSQLAVAIDGRGARRQRRARQARAVRRGREHAAADPQRPASRPCGASSPTRATVFDALSERDEQLRALIENSNRVFATTAARNRELAETFRVAADVRARVGADGRPAGGVRAQRPTRSSRSCARRRGELSPTLQEPGGARARPEGALPRPRPADRRVGARAARRSTRFLDELHPLLGGARRPLRQLNPILGFVGATTSASSPPSSPTSSPSTQATTGRSARTRVHYLRTINPSNPENLAVYPRRIGTNRPNPYQFPGAFDGARVRAAAVYETRHCGRGVPTLVTQPLPAGTRPTRPDADPDDPGPAADRAAGGPGRSDPTALIPAPLAANIQRFFYATTAGGSVAAPAVPPAAEVSLRPRGERDHVRVPAGRRRGPGRPGPEPPAAACEARLGTARRVGRWPIGRAGGRGAPARARGGRAAGRRGRGARAAARAERGDGHARRPGHASSPGDASACHQRFGDDAVYVARPRALSQLVADPDLDRVLGLEGCLVGQRARRAHAARRRDGPVRARWRATKPVQGRLRARARSSTRRSARSTTSSRRSSAARRRRPTGRRRRARKLARARADAAAGQAARRAGRAARATRSSCSDDARSSRCKYGLTRRPQLNDPSFVSRLVFDPSRAARNAEGALRLPVPDAATAR